MRWPMLGRFAMIRAVLHARSNRPGEAAAWLARSRAWNGDATEMESHFAWMTWRALARERRESEAGPILNAVMGYPTGEAEMRLATVKLAEGDIALGWTLLLASAEAGFAEAEMAITRIRKEPSPEVREFLGGWDAERRMKGR